MNCAEATWSLLATASSLLTSSVDVAVAVPPREERRRRISPSSLQY